jgi:nucleoside-diphosphate-sugar epimerase
VKIAILGAGGFLGTNLSRSLVRAGHEVDGFVLNPSKYLETEVRYKSVTELISSLDSNIGEYDVTINLAAKRSTSANPISEISVNEFTFDIPKQFLLKTAKPGTLVVNASTYIQNYGGIEGKTIDSYGSAKQRLTRFLAEESNGLEIRVLDLFFFTIYGNGDRPTHLLPALLNAAKNDIEIDLTPGNQLINLIFVSDAVENIMKSIEYSLNEPYLRYSMWKPEYITVRELVSELEIILGKKLKCNWGSRQYSGHEMLSPWDSSMEVLPWFETKINLLSGVSKLLST